MELLRDDGEVLQTIDLIGIDNRAYRPVALAVLDDSIRRHTSRHQRIPHALRLINTIQTVLITTDQYLLYLPSLIQLLSSIDAIDKEVVLNPGQIRGL